MIQCPQCLSKKVWKDGVRTTISGDVQRFLCRICGYRFSEPKIQFDVSGQIFESSKAAEHHSNGIVAGFYLPIKKISDSCSLSRGKQVSSHGLSTVGKTFNSLRICNSEHQVCADKGAKNLNPTAKIENALGGKIETHRQDIKGKILELLIYMKRQNYAESTITLFRIALKVLQERGADLADPESVKEVLATACVINKDGTKGKPWSGNRKRNVINAYTLFLKIQGLHWEKPKVNISRGFPFIPTEQELDALIAGSGKKNASFLQLLKETAMRCGEAKRLMWINVDFEKNIITLNAPEKGSNPRMWKVSSKLMAMLNRFPRISEKVFGEGPVTSMKTTLIKSRKRLAFKLQNPRLLRISFNTFRHWKATMLYHKTKDTYYVKNFLGHKSLKSTEIYINIERALFEAGADDAFTVKVAEKPEEVKSLLEIGFEYVCQKDNLIFLRKRK